MNRTVEVNPWIVLLNTVISKTIDPLDNIKTGKVQHWSWMYAKDKLNKMYEQDKQHTNNVTWEDAS